MRWFRGMAMVLVGIMLLTISGSAFAAVKDDTVSPLYLYTRKVKASLTISDSGKATCVGHIKANNMKSDISMTVTRSQDHHGQRLLAGAIPILVRSWRLRKPGR